MSTHPEDVRAVPVAAGLSVRPRAFRSAGSTAIELLVFGVLPAAVFCWWIAFAVIETSEGSLIHWAFDTRQYWQGWNDVMSGTSPYPTAESVAAAGETLDSVGILETFRFSYPAFAAVIFAPLGLLGFDLAAAIWAVFLVASLFAAVWVLGVRDWRVMGIVIGSAPVISAVRIGTMTPVLVLLLAVAWRWRDRRWVVSGAIAIAIALKLFLLPLVVWMTATRRWKEALLTSGLATGGTIAAWAVIGFDGLADYPETLRRLTEVVQDRGFSLVALGVEAGLSESAAEAIPIIVGVPLAVCVVVLGRRAGGDMPAFTLAVVASLALAPIVWQHYFALLVVPLALAYPKLSWAWGLMLVFWLVPYQEHEGDLWRISLALAVVVALCALVLLLRLPRVAR